MTGSLGCTWGRTKARRLFRKPVHGSLGKMVVVAVTKGECCAELSLSLCDPMDCSPPGSCVHGILQARTLEWAAVSYSSESCSVMSNSFQPRGLYSPWDSPGQNTGVGSRSLLQGIFQTPWLNPRLPHCRQILYQLSHQGSPSYSRGSSQSRNQTSSLLSPALAGRFFTTSAT